MTDLEVMETLLAGKTLVSGDRLAWKMVDGTLCSPDRFGAWGRSTYSWLGLDNVTIKPEPEPVDSTGFLGNSVPDRKEMAHPRRGDHMNCPKCNEPRILLLTSYACGCGRPKVESKSSQEPVLLETCESVKDWYARGRVIRCLYNNKVSFWKLDGVCMVYRCNGNHSGWREAWFDGMDPVMVDVAWHLMPEGFEP